MHKSLPDLLHSIHESRQTMVAQLHQFCEINSASSNLAGLHTMRQTLHSAFIPLADKIKTINFPPIPSINMEGDTVMLTVGDALFIRKRPKLQRRILLSGHMDTVYNLQHPFQKLTFLDENLLNGPGVADMKGGLIVMLHALAAFEKTPFINELGWDVLITGDEEIGSMASSNFIKQIAQDYKAALIYEPAMNIDGVLAKNRKGSGKVTIIAKGKAAHAGRSFAEGRNAIAYLAEVIIAVDELNGKKEGITINVGKVAGGSALNVVPDTAVAKFDVRITHQSDEKWFKEQMQNIVTNLTRKDYFLEVHNSFERPVKRINMATKNLFQKLQFIADEINIKLDWKDSGGCCDGNNFASFGLAVLDTLGVLGDNIHSPQEYILLDSLVSRSSLSALLLVELAQGGLEDLHTLTKQSL